MRPEKRKDLIVHEDCGCPPDEQRWQATFKRPAEPGYPHGKYIERLTCDRHLPDFEAFGLRRIDPAPLRQREIQRHEREAAKAAAAALLAPENKLADW